MNGCILSAVVGNGSGRDDTCFIQWFNDTAPGGKQEIRKAAVRSAVAHLYFEYLLHSISKPQLHPDVVTDMYEALEALAKIVTGRCDKDLSSNAELFVKAVQVSELYRPILKEYVVYGNKIRHAGRDGQPKPDLTRKEVESFVYLTGVFIRLAVIEEAQA